LSAFEVATVNVLYKLLTYLLTHNFSQPLGQCQGDWQRKQQLGLIDQGSDKHQERTRQVNKLR